MRPTLKIELDSAAESVGIARANVRLFGEACGLSEALIGDLVTVVSEACSNVVLHAYPEGPGPFVLSIAVADSSVHIEVRDFGRGARTLVSRGAGLGLGVALMRQLAALAEFESRPGGGMRVTMTFPRVDASRRPDERELRAAAAERAGAPASQSHPHRRLSAIQFRQLVS